jgi:phenylpyruvate tautomerase PptA (4-oxalocrotonate tautomerase family)
MPFTTAKVVEGVFTEERKTRLIEKITEAMIEVEGEGSRDLTWVVIERSKPMTGLSEAGRSARNRSPEPEVEIRLLPFRRS